MSVELKVGNRVTVEVIELRSDNPGMNDYWVVNEIISTVTRFPTFNSTLML